MTLATVIVNNQNLNKLTHFKNYLIGCLGLLDIKYTPDIFNMYLDAILLRNNLGLKNMENVITAFDNLDITTKLGMITENTMENNEDNTSKYEGYQVMGDYSKNTSQNTTTTNNKAYNVFNEYKKILNGEMIPKVWLSTVNEISNLCFTFKKI